MWLLSFIGLGGLNLPNPGLQMCEINYFAFYYFLQKYFLLSLFSLVRIVKFDVGIEKIFNVTYMF